MNKGCITRLQINHRADAGGRLIVENAQRIVNVDRSDKNKKATPPSLKFEKDRFEMIGAPYGEHGNYLILPLLAPHTGL